MIKQTHCPGCNSADVKEFFEAQNVPVQSVVTIKTFEEAVAVPKKDFTLAFCKNCGFIYNSSFDTTIDHYTKGYEDQQGFSAIFTNFITRITQRFIDKYDINNKDILEIGCGKGDFLQLICELGNNRGIGVDPAYVPSRLKPNQNVRFIKEFYSEKHGELPADVIVCRHTLEHINDTGNFVKTIRKSIKNNKEVLLLFEVPSVVRILKINAFWDLYYEHCSYFSNRSLAQLFEMNGFEVLDTYTEYDDQYLFLEAKTGGNIRSKTRVKKETIEQLSEYIDDFVKNINQQLGQWHDTLLQMKKQNKKVVIWGGGSKAVGFLTHFNHLEVIGHVVDINPHIQGNYIPGIGIQYVNPAFLREYKPDTIIVMNGIYKNEISKELHEMNLSPELICL
ncbi:MAG: methyltransferase domain-containing protein [Prolixibacteraceae bacterium]|nr:methyltransferase domain-containing protein [Prolixibacteraceae bacterium]